MGISYFFEYVSIMWISLKVVPICSFSSAKYVWPLTDMTYSYEIKNSKAGDYTQCGFHFDGDHPSFARPPLQLNAYTFPYINVGIDNSNEFKSFSFAMYVYISGSTGCVFHFKSNTPISGTIEDVRVCISGETLTMKVTSVSGTSSNTVLSVASLQGQWVMVQAGRDYDSSTEKFIVSNSLKDSVDSLGSLILGLPGTLRIGANHDDSMALPMMATCITMYDVTTNTASDVGNIENQCKSPPTASGIPNTASTGCPVSVTTTNLSPQSTESTTTPQSTEGTTTPQSTVTNTIPQSTESTTTPQSTEGTTTPQSTVTNTIPQSTESTTTPQSTECTTTPQSTEGTTTHHPTVGTTTPQSIESITTPLSTVTTMDPQSTVHTTSTTVLQSTVTNTESLSTETTVELQSTETIRAVATTEPAKQCMRTELGSSPIKRSGSFTLLKENAIVDNSSDLILTVNVSKKRLCAVACIEDDGCFSFLFRELEIGLSLCSLFKTLTPLHVGAISNSYLYTIKCQ